MDGSVQLEMRFGANNYAPMPVTIARGKGVLFATAHLGNWELGITYLVEKGYAVSGVYAPYREDDVVRWIMAHRAELARNAPDAEVKPVELARWMLGLA